MASILKVDKIRGTGLDSDTISLDGTGNITIPKNVTFTGTITGAGGMELLQTQTASADVANITFTSAVLTSTYSKYFVTGNAIGYDHFYLYPSIDNGSNYNLSTASFGEGRYNNVAGNNSGEFTSAYKTQGAGAAIPIMGDVAHGTAATQKGMAMFSGYIFNSTNYSVSRTSCYFGMANRMYGASDNYHTMPSYSGGTTFTNASAWNNLKFQFNSGNIIATSTISLYGIK